MIATVMPVPIFLILWTLVAFGLARMFGIFRGTTLLSPWAWACISALAIAAYELLSGERSTESAGLRFLVYATTFCPQMSLLGAKRPQDQAWHFVVVGLWLTIVLPACESWFRGGGRPLEIHGFRTAFLLGLIAFGPINAIATRHFWQFLLFAIAQSCWFAEWMPIRPFHGAVDSWGMVPASIAMVMYLSAKRQFSSRAAEKRPQSVNHVWRDFRDSYGVVWGLRVLERINAGAVSGNWRIRLTWDGFVSTNDDTSITTDEDRDQAERALKLVLWRFVDDRWIESRLR